MSHTNGFGQQAMVSSSIITMSTECHCSTCARSWVIISCNCSSDCAWGFTNIQRKNENGQVESFSRNTLSAANSALRIIRTMVVSCQARRAKSTPTPHIYNKVNSRSHGNRASVPVMVTVGSITS